MNLELAAAIVGASLVGMFGDVLRREMRRRTRLKGFKKPVRTILGSGAPLQCSKCKQYVYSGTFYNDGKFECGSEATN